MEDLQGVSTVLSAHLCKGGENSQFYVTSANEGHSTTEPRHSHVFFTLRANHPLPLIPPFLLMLTWNLSPKDMPKVTYHNMKI